MKINLIEIKTRLRRIKYRISSDLFTMDNLILGLSFVIAFAWIWGSISSMERNYSLQQQLEMKKREKIIAEIRHKTLEYENNYLKSEEYQELAARSELGLVADGEQVLILSNYPEEKAQTAPVEKSPSNFSQWMNFLFGGNARKSSK